MRKMVVSLLAGMTVAGSCGAALNFYDDFEALYSVGQTFVTATNGWQASSTAAYVTNSAGYTNSRAAFMGEIVALTNRVNGGSNLRVWTDFKIRLKPGLLPPALATNTSSFMVYANTNGYLVVAVSGGVWRVCSNRVDNTPAALLQSNAFCRLSIFQDFTQSPPRFAVFIAGDLVAQGLVAPANVSQYTAFVANNRDGAAIIDDVRITTDLLPGLTSDLDGNGIRDALEIHYYGLTGIMKQGTLITVE